MVDISTTAVLEECRYQKTRHWKHLAFSSPKTHRLVLAPSWLWSNRARKTAPGVDYVIYTVLYGTYILVARNTNTSFYLGAHEVQASAVSAQVDEGVVSTLEA